MPGMFGGYTPEAAPPLAVPQFPEQMPSPKKGGMFGGKMDWAGLLQSVIGGYLAGRGVPMGGMILNQVHDRQMMKQRQAMHQQDRQDDLSDYRAKLGIQQEFAQPDMTSYARDLMAAGIQPGTPKFNQLYGQYVQQKAMTGGSPFGGLFTNPADGQQYMRPNLPPLGEEMDDPRTQGGPTPPASGMFP